MDSSVLGKYIPTGCVNAQNVETESEVPTLYPLSSHVSGSCVLSLPKLTLEWMSFPSLTNKQALLSIYSPENCILNERVGTVFFQEAVLFGTVYWSAMAGNGRL